MAGHSKWANIKHRKAAQDAKRGKVFTKLIRELVIAAKQGGPAVEDNPRLRAAVDKALGANMTAIPSTGQLRAARAPMTPTTWRRSPTRATPPAVSPCWWR